jgi:hypothetical protein
MRLRISPPLSMHVVGVAPQPTCIPTARRRRQGAKRAKTEFLPPLAQGLCAPRPASACLTSPLRPTCVHARCSLATFQRHLSYTCSSHWLMQLFHHHSLSLSLRNFSFSYMDRTRGSDAVLPEYARLKGLRESKHSGNPGHHRCVMLPTTYLP